MPGPISFGDMLALWKSVTDEAYWRPLVEQPNSGIEAVEQAFAQYERASLAIDRTTQAMFILPWSGQTDEPASGAVRATVTLRFTRSGAFVTPLVIGSDLVFAHYPEDFSKDGTIQVRSGRRYYLAAPLVVAPGDAGPIDAVAVAERPGHNYNAPLSDTITLLEQAGAGLSNTGASVLNQGSVNVLRLDVSPDVIGPLQIGQYVALTAGANAGQVRRVVGYLGAVEGVHGGDVQLDGTWLLKGTMVGTAQIGETMEQGTVRGRVLYTDGEIMLLEARSAGTFALGPASLTTSGAVYTITAIEQSAIMAPELGTAEWRVLSWADDLGLAVTNPASPSGGRSPMLDELGGDRGVDRSPGEPDDVYRWRVARPADTVSPNAIRRAANGVLAPLGQSACLREVGSSYLPGLFFDAGSSLDAPQDPASNFAFDMDFAIAPEDRFKLLLGLREMRGFFLVGVPPITTGDFGVPFDATNDGVNAFDAVAPALNFLDGFPVDAADVYGAVYNAVDRARAAGVSFDLYIETIGCY